MSDIVLLKLICSAVGSNVVAELQTGRGEIASNDSTDTLGVDRLIAKQDAKRLLRLSCVFSGCKQNKLACKQMAPAADT